jgi:hypothetical protein
MTMRVYDASEVSIAIGGINIEAGFADGEFLRIEQESDDFSDVVGTDGEVTRSKTKDKRATATILLMQSSQSNQALSALSNLDKTAPNGAGVVPFLVRDRNGDSLYESQHCWIMKGPDVSFDREATAREWTIRIANLERFDAGT